MVTWHVLAESVQGASHKRHNLPNQDAIAYYPHDNQTLPLIVAVADGHGSKRCRYSHLGSQFAVQSAIESARQVFNHNLSLPQIRELAETFAKTISRCWRDKVDNYINEYLKPEYNIKNRYLPFGTTLLIVCLLNDCLLCWQIGDGDIVIINHDNSLCFPIAVDERLLANDTTSLCSHKAWADFRYAFLPLITQLPKAIFLVTDGYKNSFKYTEGFYQALSDIHDFILTEGENFVKQELTDWLNESSKKGSGDDISLAVVYSIDC